MKNNWNKQKILKNKMFKKKLHSYMYWVIAFKLNS